MIILPNLQLEKIKKETDTENEIEYYLFCKFSDYSKELDSKEYSLEHTYYLAKNSNGLRYIVSPVGLDFLLMRYTKRCSAQFRFMCPLGT